MHGCNAKRCRKFKLSTVHDSKDELLKTASDTNPVVVKYNISTCHLFYEFKEDSYLDDKNPNFDFEGFFAVDLYSKNGQLCGVLAFVGQKDYLNQRNLAVMLLEQTALLYSIKIQEMQK
jgi:hypothetical protein